MANDCHPEREVEGPFGRHVCRLAEAHATLLRTTTILAVAVLAATGSAKSAAALSQDAQAQALLAKHRAYVGWQFGDGTFKSMRIAGYVTNEQGEKTERFVLLSQGLVYHDVYTELKLGDITSHAGFTGNLFWRSDFNGFTTPIYGDRAKFLASFTLLQQEGTTELPASFVENKTVDGKPVGVVRVTLKNGDAIDLGVDPQTGAYVAATIDPGGAGETTYHILSYRDVLPGKKMMAAYRIDDDESIHNYDNIEPNAAVTNAELHPPAPTASWTFGSQDSFPITLTPNRILIDATVNGVKGRFILDTGATAIALDEAFADRAKVETLEGKSEAATMRGRVPTRARRAGTIALGGSTLHNVLVFSENFRSRDYRGLDRQGYDGLIGYDLFAGAIVKLDVYGSKMTLLDPTSDLTGTRGLPLLVDLSDRNSGDTDDAQQLDCRQRLPRYRQPRRRLLRSRARAQASFKDFCGMREHREPLDRADHLRRSRSVRMGIRCQQHAAGLRFSQTLRLRLRLSARRHLHGTQQELKSEPAAVATRGGGSCRLGSGKVQLGQVSRAGKQRAIAKLRRLG